MLLASDGLSIGFRIAFQKSLIETAAPAHVAQRNEQTMLIPFPGAVSRARTMNQTLRNHLETRITASLPKSQCADNDLHVS
jgi:hypothetical protein